MDIKHAFYDCDGLTQITLPNTITTIGSSAFCSSGLTSITLPPSLEKLHDNAFSYCSKLIEVVFPANLKEIGRMAFYKTSITTLSIPKTVVSIGHQAFADCENLISITVENGNSKYYAPEGSNAVFKGDTLLLGCKTTANIPNGKKVRSMIVTD